MTFRFLLTSTTCALLATPAVFAQTDDETADDGDSVEEIIVTGSRLARRDFESTSPIATIERDDILSSGHATLEESLNKMPQVSPDFGRTSNNPGDGTARINLRDLGAGRSLVLLNGRRIAPSGIDTAVDVNNLPQVLIERVEVITGGASTVYGSDAIAGVANFITRNDFDGFGVDTSIYITEQSDSQATDVNVTWGHNFANGKGNLTLYGGYLDRDPTFQSAREFTEVTWGDNWDGTVSLTGSSRIPGGLIQFPAMDLGNGPGRITFDSNGDPVYYNPATDYFNYAPLNYLQTPLRRVSGGAMLNYDLGTFSELYAEVQYAQNRAKQNLAPVPAGDFFAINTDNPVLTPATQQLFAQQGIPLAPGIAGVVILRRMLEMGPRIKDSEREYLRGVVGWRGDITDNWDFDIWATYTTADEVEQFLNDVSRARFQQGLLVDPATGQCFDPSNGCVPLNFFGEGNLSPEGVDFIRHEPYANLTTRTQRLVSGFVRGAPFETWAGKVDIALGAEWRDDDGYFKADDRLFLGDAMGFTPDASVQGRESVTELYAEAIIPLLDDSDGGSYLALEVGGRYSTYNNAGDSKTWKVGFDWRIANAPVRFRVMQQRSVRAPTLAEAFTERGFSEGSYVGSNSSFDPCSASNDPLGHGIEDACVASGLPQSEVGTWEATPGSPTTFYFGGNPNLEPEKSTTLTAGIVFDFDWLQGAQVSIDYFDLDVEDTIGGLLVDLACYDPANTQNVYCDAIVRDPFSYNISELYEFNVNKGGLKTSGVDVQLQIDADLPDSLAITDGGAGLAVSAFWTHTLENSYQETPFGTVVDCAGTFGWPCQDQKFTSTYPEDRVSASIIITAAT